MSALIAVISQNAARLVSIAIVSVLYWLVQLPELPDVERAQLATQFNFSKVNLPELPGPTPRYLRAVHPSLEHISAWISSVGASVAINDLDGDSFYDDICYVNTRTDQVIIVPVPGNGAAYEPFTLDPNTLLYDTGTMAPMGCLPGDLNEDGLMDILVYYWGRTPIAFLQRSEPSQEQAVFSNDRYIAREMVNTAERWFTNAATFADLDGDGHVDLVVGNYFQDGAQILDANASGHASMQHSMSKAFNAGRNRLLLWTDATSGTEPTVLFTEAVDVLDEETEQGWTLAVGAADLDGDLLPELYFANDFGPDRLLHNRSQPGQLQFTKLEGIKTITTPKSKVLGQDSFKGMGVDFGDLNGDGLLDIYVSNIASEFSLEESHFVFLSTGKLEQMAKGIAPYTDQSERLGLSRSGWGWETRLADFNNDGVLEAIQATGFVKGITNRWPELHELAMGNDELLSNPSSWPHFHLGDDLSGRQHNPFFVRAQDGRYYDLAPDLGLDTLQVSRGIATSDVDRDGDLDFAVANQWEPSVFYHNECANCGAFLGLDLRLALPPSSNSIVFVSERLQSVTPSRPAVGATAIVNLPNGQRLTSQVDGGNGHSGARSPVLHFGLGKLTSAMQFRVELQWRDLNGQVRQETLSLAPGWHTVMLGTHKE